MGGFFHVKEVLNLRKPLEITFKMVTFAVGMLTQGTFELLLQDFTV
jgi:hypothetical protein